MTIKSLIQCLSSEFGRMQSPNLQHSENGKDCIEFLCKEFMPSGSGFDSGTQFDFDKSRYNRFAFNTSFHHMTEHGFYDGWTEHVVYVEPTFDGFHVNRVSGRNRNDIKDYIAETFDHCLRAMIWAQWNDADKAMLYAYSQSGANLPTNSQ